MQNLWIATWLPQAVWSWSFRFPCGASHCVGKVGARNADSALLFLLTQAESSTGSCVTAEHLSGCVKTLSSHCQMPGAGVCLFVCRSCWNKLSRNKSLSVHMEWCRKRTSPFRCLPQILGYLQWTWSVAWKMDPFVHIFTSYFGSWQILRDRAKYLLG